MIPDTHLIRLVDIGTEEIEQTFDLSADVTEDEVAGVLLMISEGLVSNTFCPTGVGGGVDPTCSPGTGMISTPRGELLYSAVRQNDKWVMEDGSDIPDHASAAAIPPAWKDVYVNPDPTGTVIARGIDAKGRTQSKYSDTHTAQAAAEKFGRVSELREKRASIFKELERDRKNPETKENAECLKVVMQTGIRPGGGDTKAEFDSFGATTLMGKHVKTRGGETYLEFVTGKNKGRAAKFPVHDKDTATMLKERAAKSGRDGNLFDTNAKSLRQYSQSKDGGGFKTKDHRTALGTEVAIAEINKIGVGRKFQTAKNYKAAVKQVATKVAGTLGNTPSIALKSYIDPQVFVGWKPPALSKVRSAR